MYKLSQLQQSSILMDTDRQIVQNKQIKPIRKPNRLLISYQYIIQGILISIPTTIILTYQNIPQYQVLSLFAFASIPYSFKFLSAPFIQTFTSIHYGKRKTWILIGSSLMSISVLVLSYLTAQKHQIYFAICCLFAMFFVTLQDIALDALCIKQMKNPEDVGFLQTATQQIGTIFGSLLLIKLTSLKFASFLGKSQPLIKIQSFFIFFSVAVLVINILIHFKYQEQVLQEQIQFKGKSIIQNIKQYKSFFKYQSKYFRQSIFLLIYYQGFNFFDAGYQIQLMKNGFSKQALNQINNIGAIPILILTFFVSKLTNSQNIYQNFYKVQLARLALYVFAFIVYPNKYYSVFIFVFTVDLLDMIEAVMIIIIVNIYPIRALSGMFITMMLSFTNLGSNKTFHYMIIGKIGFQLSCLFGFLYEIAVFYYYRRVTDWIKQGKINIAVNQLAEEQL